MRRLGDWSVLGLVAAAVFVPLIVATWRDGVAFNYLASVVFVMVVYAIFSLGLSLEFGHTGLVNFGHVASMAVGAYTMGLVAERLEDPEGALGAGLSSIGIAGPDSALGQASALGSLMILLVGASYAALAAGALRGVFRRIQRPASRRDRRRAAWAGGAIVGLAAVASCFPLPRGGQAFSTYLTANTAAGFLVVALLAIVAAALVFVLVIHVAPRLLRRSMSDRNRILVAAIPAAAAGLALLASWFPLERAAAQDAVVYVSILFALVLAAASGLALGLPAIRLREDYLAIVAIGAAEILRSVLQNEEWLTHGTLGVRRLQRPVVDWALSTPWWQAMADAIDVRPVILAHLAVGALALAYIFLVLQLLASSPWGRVLRAVREDEDVARSLGKDVSAYKLQALMIGSAVGGFAGILLVWNLSNIYPEHFPPLVTFFAFIIVIVGGIGNHRGALVGTVVLWGVFELARNLTILQEWGIADLSGPPQAIVIGVLLVLVVMFRPHGLVGRKEELVHAR